MSDVIRWHLNNGGHFRRPANHALRLLHEVVELCIASGALSYEIMEVFVHEVGKADVRNEWGGDPAKVHEEWADCAMLLEVFAYHAMINQQIEIEKKLKVLLTRQWETDYGGALYRPGTKG